MVSSKTREVPSDEIVMLLMQLRHPGNDWQGMNYGHGDPRWVS